MCFECVRRMRTNWINSVSENYRSQWNSTSLRFSLFAVVGQNYFLDSCLASVSIGFMCLLCGDGLGFGMSPIQCRICEEAGRGRGFISLIELNNKRICDVCDCSDGFCSISKKVPDKNLFLWFSLRMWVRLLRLFVYRYVRYDTNPRMRYINIRCILKLRTTFKLKTNKTESSSSFPPIYSYIYPIPIANIFPFPILYLFYMCTEHTDGKVHIK